MNGLNPRIFAAYTNEELYFDPAVIVILSPIKSFSLLTLLGIFNSKLAIFYHFNTSPKATKGAFPKLLITDINNFPLPIHPNSNITSQIDLLVSNVIANYDETLSEKIDTLVYKLYELNDNDINLIDNAI